MDISVNKPLRALVFLWETSGMSYLRASPPMIHGSRLSDSQLSSFSQAFGLLE